MIETSFADLLLAWLLTYGTPLFGLVLFGAGLGLPLPASALVIAAGAFARLGLVNPVELWIVGLVTVVLGDNLSFLAGHFGGQLGRSRLEGSPRWLQAQKMFNDNAGKAIYFSRFLVTVVSMPVNLIAGGGGYPHRKFFFWDVLGEGTWLVLYGGAGYLFGSQWELVNEIFSDISGILLGVLLLLLGRYIWVQRERKHMAS